MDYKKKYEEAMLRMNKWVEGSEIVDPKEVAEYVFPELKKSEDKRIRKALIHYFSEQDGILTAINGSVSVGDILAWLEKQGEKIDAIENLDTEFEKQVSHLIASAINKEHEYNQSYVKWTANALLNYAKHELEKQGEQKPTDKVEPKFKVGDTIVEKDLDEYDYETIKDIKDGQYIFTDGYSMNIDEQEGWQLVKTTVNIEQKPAWSEKHIADVFEKVGLAKIVREQGNDELMNALQMAMIELAKQGEQKPVEWSAYDKATLEYIIEDIKELCDNETEEGSIETYNRELNLLQAINNSIKLSSYTNPAAWSEEDERYYDSALWHIKNSCGIEGNIYNWLKSLRERYAWKPSDEQMKFLWKYAEQNNYDGAVLTSLFRDLKKLKEE